MLTDEELGALLSDLESDRVERKESALRTDRIGEAVCAFANDLPNYSSPGVVFVGVKDDGACAGLEITDDLLRRLAEIRETVLPFPTMHVLKRRLRGCDVAVIVVEPSDITPLRFQQRVWIRVGPRRAAATPEEERRLTEKGRARNPSFDLWQAPGATIDDLDLDLFSRTYLPASVAPEVLEQNQRSVEQQLASLRLIRGSIPTVAGILTVGKDPRSFLPGAYVQFLRLDGAELTDPIRDAAAIGGPLSELIRALEDKLEAHIETAREFVSTPIDVQKPDYPITALQQITRNAILHRTYEGTNAPVRISWFSDRIEIQNPGGPYGQVNRTNFGQPGATDYRNPALAEAMRNLGYVQKFGMGIVIAGRELEKNGNPPLQFIIEDTHILSILRRRP
jgi:ATP-dependent DNA helicase RecG